MRPKHFVFNRVVETKFTCTNVDKVSVSSRTPGPNRPGH